MHQSQSRRNLITLANLVELTTQAVLRTIKNGDVKSIGGVPQTRQSISDTVAVKLNSRLSDHLQG